ncbi:hypothetical protein C2G38_2169340 [Gigaspora rosea]|uniref:Uncharacterized protein n=1 Tax=Gigaspora rosea TaxID=44941 RepID=A0A397VQE7_9GLOM|nr:hypothetical protein C2G38_2169340 [Gigaspora rosea]
MEKLNLYPGVEFGDAFGGGFWLSFVGAFGRRLLVFRLLLDGAFDRCLVVL